MNETVADKFRNFAAKHNLRFYMAAYQSSGNPVFLWHCYKEIRKLGIEMPPWMFEYFDGIASSIENRKPPLEALGFSSNKAYAMSSKTQERLRTYQNYWYLRNELGLSYNDATEKLAQQNGSDVRTIQRHINEVFPADQEATDSNS